MSRYDFNAAGTCLAIGWDGPLATFFLMVWIDAQQDDSEDDEPQLWIGASYGEAPDAEALLTIARRYVAKIPADFAKQLLTDQMRQSPRALAPGATTLERVLNTLAGHPPIQPTHH